MTSVVSAITGSGAVKAGKVQAAAAQDAIGIQTKTLSEQIKLARESLQIQKDMFDTAVEFGEPYRNAGSAALANYESLLYGIPVNKTASYQAAATPMAKTLSDYQKEQLYVTKAKQFLPDTAVLTNAEHRPGGLGSAGGQNYKDPATGMRYVVDTSTGNILQKKGNSGSWSVVPGSEGLQGVVDAEIARLEAPGESVPVQGIENPDAVYDWQTTPGYQFRMDEGQKALDRSAAARSGVLSGAQIKATQRYGQDYATNEFDNALKRLAELINTGANMAGAAGNQALSSANSQSGVLSDLSNSYGSYGENVGALTTQIGAAKASGYLGQQAAGTNLLNNAFSLAGASMGGFGGGGGVSSGFTDAGWQNFLATH